MSPTSFVDFTDVGRLDVEPLEHGAGGERHCGAAEINLSPVGAPSGLHRVTGAASELTSNELIEQCSMITSLVDNHGFATGIEAIGNVR